MAGLRWFARGFVVTVVVGLALTFLPTTSRAAGTYTATANARLVGVDFTAVPGHRLRPAGRRRGVGRAGPDRLARRTTRAFASSPYPSESVVLLPGLIAGITGGQTSALLPPYPLIAATNETTPVDHRELGPLVLDAQSTAGNSRGSVTDGATRAVARTTADDARRGRPRRDHDLLAPADPGAVARRCPHRGRRHAAPPTATSTSRRRSRWPRSRSSASGSRSPPRRCRSSAATSLSGWTCRACSDSC